MTFGATLKRLRESRRVSQSRLAMRIERDHTTVCRWELGERHPTRANVMAVATALDLSDHETDELRQAAGFAPRHSPEVERFKRLPPDVQRAALEFIERVRTA